MKLAMAIFVALLLLPSGLALVSVSHMGYHPEGVKSATVYTSAGAGTYRILDAGNNVVRSGVLTKPIDFNGNNVSCQGNNPCLVVDFSTLKTPGIYRINTSFGETSRPFIINASVYRDNIPLFNEFFDALAQQDSSYHADFNSFADPSFNAMADGSFLMTANFASTTLMRMGDAYRKNPVALSADTRTILRANTPDIVEHMMLYATHLEDLQDAKLQVRSDGAGFRLNTGMKIDGAFVPGSTAMTSLNVYDSGDGFIQSVPVVSMCGNLSGSAYTQCVNDAALYYKCQIDEPCLQMSYIEQTATRIIGQTDGLGVDEGWLYEFGCFYDVDLQNGNFNGANANPCMVYDVGESRKDTAQTLLAYVEAIPAINQYNSTMASEMLGRSIQTHAYIKATYPAFVSGDSDAGFFGAAGFLLYDLTGNISYLNDSHNMRTLIPSSFVSDQTRGNEFYWQEYARHKGAIIGMGKQYLIGTTDPVDYFRGKMYGDYKDLGFRSISANGEHVYQFDNNIQFQNSRYMLTEGLLAAKTRELSSDTAPLIQNIADAQLAWLTGNNGVDFDSGFTNDIQSVSFIFGIGGFPTQYHSRLLMSSGYDAASGGQVKGMRGSGLKFYNGTSYVYLDGKTTILGTVLGAQGNTYRGEAVATQLVNKTYTNGKTFIPGWINGAYDLNYDTDDIFNYRDNRETYEFTESTNEIVATALSLFAYNDAYYNNVTALAVPYLGTGNFTPPNGTTNTTNTTTNTTNSTGCFNSLEHMPVSCVDGSFTQDTYNGCRTLICANGANTLQILACDKSGFFEMYKQTQTGQQLEICIGTTCISDGGYAKSANFPICIGTNTTAANISFTSVSPVSTSVIIAEPASQSFSYALNSPSGTMSTWLINGTSVATNVSSYTFSGGYATQGSYNVTVRVQSSQNVIERSWSLVIANTANNATNSTNATCYSALQSIPAVCTGGTIISDVLGGCRTITCTNSTSSMKIQACDKGAFFEMYKQQQNGTLVSKLCIGNTCITNNGYAKSSNYPICIGGNTTSPPNTTNTTTNTTNSTNTTTNVTSGMINATLGIAPWFPQGKSYVFVCNATGFTPTNYDFTFGDGHTNNWRTTNDVYYTYAAAGTFNASCTARNATRSVTGVLKVVVS